MRDEAGCAVGAIGSRRPRSRVSGPAIVASKIVGYFSLPRGETAIPLDVDVTRIWRREREREIERIYLP